MVGKIRKLDHTGDSVLAEFNTEQADTVKIAQDKLTAFLDSCVKQFGKQPPVWHKRMGEKEFSPMDQIVLDEHTEEVLVQYPIAGG